MNKTAEYYIEKLGLLPHPEGGFFKETYRSTGIIKKTCLEDNYSGDRNFSTLIYFLLQGENISILHRLKSDEIWHFYDGCPVELVIINEQGNCEKIILGRDLSKRETFQTVIEKNSWFGAELADKDSYALLGCSVSPGFQFEDFELGKRKDLLMQFPYFEKEIKKLTKNE